MTERKGRRDTTIARLEVGGGAAAIQEPLAG
jgi:hypothetical protein